MVKLDNIPDNIKSDAINYIWHNLNNLPKIFLLIKINKKIEKK